MGAFILVIFITVGTGEALESFEMQLNKDSKSECLKDAEKFHSPLPIISIETRCESVIGDKLEMQDAGIAT